MKGDIQNFKSKHCKICVAKYRSGCAYSQNFLRTSYNHFGVRVNNLLSNENKLYSLLRDNPLMLIMIVRHFVNTIPVACTMRFMIVNYNLKGMLQFAA